MASIGTPPFATDGYFHLADVFEGDFSAIDLANQVAAAVVIKDWAEVTRLIEGISNNQKEKLIHELKNHPEIIEKNGMGDIPLFSAIASEEENIVSLLLTAHPDSVNIKSPHGRSALYYALNNPNERLFRIVVSARPRLEAFTGCHFKAMRQNNIRIRDLFMRCMPKSLLLACGLVAARTDTAPSSLRTFVCSRIFEPRVMGLVKQFL